MKGKDLIEYIRTYGLEECDFPVCEDDGMIPGYISIEDASRKYHISMSKIRALIREDQLRVIRILGKDLLYEAESEDILKESASGTRTNTHKWKEQRRHEFKRKSVD